MRQIRIKSGSVEAIADLDENATADAIWDALPITGRANTWGDEIYFDIPLYDYLKQYCRRIYLAVKGGPSLNDLTRAELQSADLANKFDPVVDTGTDGAGIDWDNVSNEFIDIMASADLIISKGMANFETLYPKSIATPSFYIFKVKCEPIQNYIQAPANNFLALWKDGNAADS